MKSKFLNELNRKLNKFGKYENEWIVFTNGYALKIEGYPRSESLKDADIGGYHTFSMTIGKVLEGDTCAVIELPGHVLSEELLNSVESNIVDYYLEDVPGELVQKIYDYIENK